MLASLARAFRSTLELELAANKKPARYSRTLFFSSTEIEKNRRIIIKILALAKLQR